MNSLNSRSQTSDASEMKKHMEDQMVPHLALMVTHVIKQSNENTEMRKQIDCHGAKIQQYEESLKTTGKETGNELSSPHLNITRETNLLSMISDLDMRVQLDENSTHDGHLIWKIENYTERKNKAVIGQVKALHSAPCFTSKYGYKYCLRLYLAGDGMGKGTHVSLFLVIMKSEYDEIQAWPFNKQVRMCLINQQDRSKDKVEKLRPDRNSSSYKKPVKNFNVAFGCPLFMETKCLENGGFLKDDAFFIELNLY